jgi:hypothetical protein
VFRRYRFVSLLLSVALLAGCARTALQHEQLDTEPAITGLPDSVLLDDVPFYPQQTYHCGPATLAMLMSYQGVRVQPDDLVDQVFIESRQGSLQAEMLAATRRQGLLPYVHDTSFVNVLTQVHAGHPVLVFENLGFDFYPVWHYALVIGYDLTQQEIVLHSGTTAELRRSFRRFELEWRGGEYWAMTMHRPGEFPFDPEPATYLEATSGLEQAEQFEAAAIAYRAAADRWPTELIAWMGLGNVHYRQQNFQNAEQAYRKALGLNEDSAAAHHNLAWALMRQENYDAAFEPARAADRLADEQGERYRSAWQSWQANDR